MTSASIKQWNKQRKISIQKATIFIPINLTSIGDETYWACFPRVAQVPVRLPGLKGPRYIITLFTMLIVWGRQKIGSDVNSKAYISIFGFVSYFVISAFTFRDASGTTTIMLPGAAFYKVD